MRPCEDDLSIGAIGTIGTIGTNGKAVSPLVNNWNLHLINTMSQQACYTWTYLVLSSMSQNKRATHEYTSLIHEPKKARYT